MSKIFTLSEASSIAIHGMVLILNTNEKLNAGNIAERVGGSRHHVAKVLQRLVKEDFLTSNRGPSGGFSLKKKPEDISLYDIYKAIEGNIDDMECPIENKICPEGKCLFGGFGKRITAEFKDYLSSTTLQSFVNE